MRKVVFILFVLTLSAAFSVTWAQCPAADSYATATTAASCPSNGIMQFTNPADVAVMGGMGVQGAIYTITSGPASGGYQTAGQSANKFEGLPAGTYAVTISKPGCPNVVKSGVVVSSAYTPINLSASVSNQCAGGQAGGTITASVTGGKAPLQYAFVQSTDASVPDESLTYGPASSTVVSSFGTYQVRAKDACGIFTTRSVTVAPNAPKAYFNPAGSTKDCNTYAIAGSLTPTVGGSGITPTVSQPYKIELFDVASTNQCTIPSGASPFQTINATSAADLKFDLAKTHPQILVRTTSSCGEVDIRCFNLDNTIGPALSQSTSPSCTQFNGINGTDILLQPSRFTPPMNVTISSGATGNPVLTTAQLTSNANKLFSVAYVSAGYIIRVEDACGQVRSLTVTSPPSATANVVAKASTNLNCANQIGAKRTSVALSGGATGLLATGSKVVLTAGPSGLISPALQASGGSGLTYYWNNLDPGIYTGQITTTTTNCGPSSFTFAVPVNSASSPGLAYNLTGSVAGLCNGNSNLTASFNYNGPNSVTYVATNSANAVVATNTNGIFNDLSPDVYSVKAIANTGCSFTFTQSKSFTVTQGGNAPTITKKVGVICENNGTPTSSGQAFFQFNGVPPYRLELKPAGSATWTTQGTGVTSSTYAIANLSANADYDFRLTDNCGKSTVSTISIKPLETQFVENTLQPCVDQNYTLSAPDLPGASYSWAKDGSAISTNREINFTPYQASSNGQYVVTIALGNNCVARQATANLTSTNCGQPLPVNLASFSAKALADNTVQVDWVTANEQGNAYFQVERSKDLATFETIGRVQPKDGSMNGSTYRYVDKSPYEGTSYYRLHQVDLSGKTTDFPAIAVVLRNEAYGVFPNPVVNARFTLSLDEPQSAIIRFYSAEGRSLNLDRTVLGSNRVSLRITDKVSTGIYLLLVEERGQTKQYRLVIQK